MAKLDINSVTEFVNLNIDSFHRNRLIKIQELRLKDVLKRKNPYLFRAKNVTLASELVSSILEASLSSSEEGLFGTFLEQLAIFINELAFSGQKSSAAGIDLEFSRDSVRYLVAIKSGPNWGNKDQHSSLRVNFRNAIKVLRQSPRVPNIQAVLGTCYGKGKTIDHGDYVRMSGQRFWEFISGEPNLYIDLIDPLGYEAKKHDDNYQTEKSKMFNKFVRDFTVEFCDPTGQIDWANLVAFNSGNGDA